MHLPRVGEIFEERYELIQVLGQGAFATVFHAADASMARDVVIKILSPSESGYVGTTAARFMREARVFATLQNPHTITMYDFGESRDGLLFMVFEYVPGRELGQLLRERGALGVDVAMHLLFQLLSALQEAHGQGVLHRDIKPANILIFAYGDDPFRAKLLDFGIAKDTSPDAQKITKTGNVVGTLRYMAPEQLSSDPVGPDTDLFSLGLVATELLTGTPVMTGKSQMQLIVGQMSESPLAVPDSAAPPALRAVIDRMMCREREGRFSSATSVLAALRVARESLSAPAIPVVPAELPAPAPRSVAREPASSRKLPPLAAMGLGVVLAFVAAGVVLAWQARPKPPPSPVRVVTLPPAAPASPVADTSPPPPVEDAGVADGGPVMPVQCGPAPFFGVGQLRTGPMDPPVTAYIPRSYDPADSHGLVVMFHRMLRDGGKIIDETQIGPEAEKYGFVVIAPTSESPTQWRGSEIPRAEQLIEKVQSRLCLDRSRVFAIGDGAGASAVRGLACARPISGFAVAFDASAKTCVPVAPSARMRLYGLRDPYVPVDGGIGCNPLAGPSPRASGIERNWRSVYGCGTSPRPWGDFPGGSCSTWDCELGPMVHCAMDLGHQWPGSEAIVSTKRCGVPPPEHAFPMTGAIAEFFEKHGHRIEPGELAPASKLATE